MFNMYLNNSKEVIWKTKILFTILLTNGFALINLSNNGGKNDDKNFII
jgi:hypothetical protein